MNPVDVLPAQAHPPFLAVRNPVPPGATGRRAPSKPKRSLLPVNDSRTRRWGGRPRRVDADTFSLRWTWHLSCCQTPIVEHSARGRGPCSQRCRPPGPRARQRCGLCGVQLLHVGPRVRRAQVAPYSLSLSMIRRYRRSLHSLSPNPQTSDVIVSRNIQGPAIFVSPTPVKHTLFICMQSGHV